MNNIDKALQTWYSVNNPKHYQLLHPALALAGESGELLDLLKKHLFKPDRDWNDIGKDGLSMIDSELGDWSYYDRIIEYISNDSFEDNNADKITKLMVELNYTCAEFTYYLVVHNNFNQMLQAKAQFLFSEILEELGKDYQDIVDKNFKKLNPDDGSQHGWKDAK